MLDLALDAASVYRLTRLLVSDGLLDTPRNALLAWASSGESKARHPKLVELISCPWCVSVYAAVGVVAARRFAPRAWQPLAEVLAFSAAAGIVSTAVGLAED